MAVLLLFAVLSVGAVGMPFEQKDPPTSQQEPNLDGTVEVSFRIDTGGKVEILKINATHPQLADYVIKKLNKIQLEKGDPQIGQIIKYRFVFKKQV
ncbi:MAG: hypothetical protein R2809_02220 [Flavobacteriales bacterium]